MCTAWMSKVLRARKSINYEALYVYAEGTDPCVLRPARRGAKYDALQARLIHDSHPSSSKGQKLPGTYEGTSGGSRLRLNRLTAPAAFCSRHHRPRWCLDLGAGATGVLTKHVLPLPLGREYRSRPADAVCTPSMYMYIPSGISAWPLRSHVLRVSTSLESYGDPAPIRLSARGTSASFHTAGAPIRQQPG